MQRWCCLQEQNGGLSKLQDCGDVDPESDVRVDQIQNYNKGNLVEMPGDEVIQDGVSKELKPLIAVSQTVGIV